MKRNLRDSPSSNNPSKEMEKRQFSGTPQVVFLAQRPQSGETPDAKPILSTFGRSVKKIGRLSL